MTKDMTVGSPVKLLLAFAWPLFLGNVIQNGYVLIDTIIVGRYLGKEALSAIGSVGAISFVIIGFVFGLSSGISVITAQYFGANNLRGIRQSIGTGVWVCSIFSLAIMLLCFLLTGPMLRLLETPNDVFDLAKTYLQISIIGVSCMMCFNLQSAMLRALGNSRTPLYFLAGASLLNIALDVLFIQVFNMGIAGAAWATNVAILASALGCFFFVTRKMPQCQLEKRDWRPRRFIAKKQMRVGIPMGLQFSITGLGAVVLQRAINQFGVVLIAGLTAAEKVSMIAVQIPIALGQAMATYSAQNFGAGKCHRIHVGVRAGVLITTCSCGLIALLSICFGHEFIGLFLSSESMLDIDAIFACGEYLLRVCAPFYIPLGYIFIFRNTLQGTGNALFPMLAGVAEMLMRMGVAIQLVPHFGIDAVYWADPAAWIGACLMLIPAYLFYAHRWKEGCRITLSPSEKN